MFIIANIKFYVQYKKMSLNFDLGKIYKGIIYAKQIFGKGSFYNL